MHQAENQSVVVYEAKLRIPNTRDAVDAVFDIGDESVCVTTGSDVLGDWPLTDVTIEDRGDALLVSLAGEAVLVDIGDRDGFTAAMVPTTSTRRRRGSKRRQRPMAESGPPSRPSEPPDPDHSVSQKSIVNAPLSTGGLPTPAGQRVDVAGKLQAIGSVFSIESWREWLQDRTVRWAVASMGVVIFAVLALFAADTTGMILVLMGMVALIVAAFAVSEDLQAYKILPSYLSETGLIVGGTVAMVVGGLLIIAV